MDISENIKTLRQKAGLTQTELGIACGWVGNAAQSRISHYENQYSEPSLNDIQVLAGPLGVTAAYLVGMLETGEYDTSDKRLLSLFSEAQLLPREKQAALITMLNAVIAQ